jgi:hypothetical protein
VTPRRPAILGTLYSGNASVLVDAFSKMEHNVVRIRLELVSDHRGAYVIASS